MANQSQKINPLDFSALQKFATELSTRLSQARKIVENLPNAFEKMEERHKFLNLSTDRLMRIAPIVAEKGWAIPNDLTVCQTIRLASSSKSNGSFYEESLMHMIDNEIFDDLTSRSMLMCNDLGVNRFFENCLDAYKRGEYALCCAGVFCIIELMYQNIHPNGRASIYKEDKFAKVIEKIENAYGYEGYMHMPGNVAYKYVDLVYGMYSIMFLFKPGYSYVGYMARNRILHGHDIDKATREDCCRLFVCASNMQSIKTGLKALDDMISDGLTPQERTKKAGEKLHEILNKAKKS